MEWSKPAIILIFLGLVASCKESSLSSLDNGQINEVLVQVDEFDESFTQKEVQFDSIVTLAGRRSLGSNTEPIKLKLFYFGQMSRGYFNLSAVDDKNLQVFGKKINDNWAFKCVTKINMEEAGGYLIFDSRGEGIWSNGHVNFDKGTIILKKQNTDYNSLVNW